MHSLGGADDRNTKKDEQMIDDTPKLAAETRKHSDNNQDPLSGW